MRYAIRTIPDPKDGPAQYLDKGGLLVDSPQDARLYYRKGDCTNSVNAIRRRRSGPGFKDYEVIGMVVITASEWDLVKVLATTLEELQEDSNQLRHLQRNGVDNWEGYSYYKWEDEEDEDD